MTTHKLAACVGLAIALPALAQPQTFLMVARGPAFTPTPDPRAIMLFDPQNGALVNADFIPGLGALYQMDFPKDVMRVGHEIWVTDQTDNAILRFDLLGGFVGSIYGNMSNIRGMEVHEGIVYVSSATASGGSPANALVKFDFAGSYLGAFPAGTSPFDALFYNGELLVANSTGGIDISRWALDGTSLGTFHSGAITTAQQLHRMPSTGNVLAAGSSTPAGLYQYDPSGAEARYIAVAGARSGFELGDGNILYTNSSGVHVFNTTTSASTMITSAPGHFINPLTVDPSATGACCLPDGTCQVLAMSACGAQDGLFRGPGTACAACPQPGACCLAGGSCVLAQPQACADQSGVWYGAGSSCAAGACLSLLRTPAPNASFINPDGAGVFIDLTATNELIVPRIDYFPTPGNGAPVMVDIYTRPGSYVGFTASPDGWTHTETLAVTSLGGTINPTRLTLTAPIQVSQGQTVGVYLVGTVGGIRYRSAATTMSNSDLAIFSNTVRSALFGGTSSVRGFAGAVFYSLAAAPCYPNCDGSTGAPLLNVNDFVCFQSRFAAGDPYANCDGSTSLPTLNVNDFVCFQSAFAAGCP